MDRKYRFVRGRGGLRIADTGISFWPSPIQSRYFFRSIAKRQVTSKLSTAKYVSKEAVVVKPPYTVATCRFQAVHVLQAPAQPKIAMKHNKYQVTFFPFRRFKKVN